MTTHQLHRNPPFRAEHIGSLLRPKYLLDARGEEGAQPVSAEELTKIEDKAIKEVVEKQLKAGIRAITDGEYRRHQFWGDFFPSLEGFKQVDNVTIDMFREYAPDIAAFLETGHNPKESIICTGKIKHTGKSYYLPAFEYLKTLVPPDRHGDIKLNMASPNWYHLRYKEGKAYPKDVYGSDEEYFVDIAKVFQQELDILYKAGVRNIQIDDPNLAYFCSEKMAAGWVKDPLNSGTSDDMFNKYVALYNNCISSRPADMHVGVHLCRGNFVHSRHFSEGGYDRIATALFQKLNVDTYYLEYDTERAGTFEPLKHLPKDKNVIVGVVTSKFPKLEDKEEMKKRVLEAAETVASGTGEPREEALKRLGVSPQCGFASHAVGNLLGMEDMEKKLQLVRAIADDIWPGEP